MITAEGLRELLNYDPDTGVFTRAVRTSTRTNIGDVAGCDNGRGYLLIRLENILYRAHRLAWLYVHGEWPDDEIDHADGNRSNNAIANLRAATRTQNMQNLDRKRSNKSGYTGVIWFARDSNWRAEITASGHHKHIGYFATAEEAYVAYLAAKADLHVFQPAPRIHDGSRQ